MVNIKASFPAQPVMAVFFPFASGPGLQSASDASRLSGQPLWGDEIDEIPWRTMVTLQGCQWFRKLLLMLDLLPQNFGQNVAFDPLLPGSSSHVCCQKYYPLMFQQCKWMAELVSYLFRIFLFIDITVACPTPASPASATGELRRARHFGWFEPRGAKGHGSVRLW